MIFIIIIFAIAIIGAFGMLVFRAWEIRTNRISTENEKRKYTTELSFRRIEKIFLFVAKYTIQGIVLFSVKTWFLITTKAKVWFQNKLPKINKFFQKKASADSRKISFIQRAVIESKIKIKRAKEKIKQEHEEKEEEISEDNEVDKIL
jgi:hypothetical protein